jgi:Eco57I restriction-modification methylase
MLPGFTGHLLSETFLEARVARQEGPHTLDQVRRDFIEWRRRSDTLGPASSVSAMLHAGAAPLVAILGFDTPSALEPDEHAVSATLAADGSSVALIVVPWGTSLDPFWRVAVVQAMRRGSAWVFLFNGVRLRLLDARKLFARRWAEFDVEAIGDDRRALAALWTICRASMFLVGAGTTPLDSVVEASDRHAAGVCRSLRDGVLAASTGVLGALVGRTNVRNRQHIGDTFEQALTVVYRILFLLFAEARSLVPVWHPVYRESYSVDSLRAAAELPHGHVGLWEALRAIARLAHAGCQAGDLRVTPFNGRLFAPARTPLAERRDLDDHLARNAVLALATRPAVDGIGRERIAYRDLGVEQLGAVYETLLDYEPHVHRQPARRGSTHCEAVLVRGSGIRKATGSFYTPQSIVEYLIRRALGPLVRDRSPERLLQLRVLDPAMGSGAFLVAACHYLASAYEMALVRAGGCHPTDIDEQQRALIRRTIAERCLYGVDLNPMAVQLARLSLWLTTLAADRPLSFLDHRLQVGDSLIGAWLTSVRRPPRATRSRLSDTNTPALFDDEAFLATVRDVLPARFSLESIPNDTLQQVREKERTLAALTACDSTLSRWKSVADLWCASWFSAKHEVPANAFGALSDRILTGRSALPPHETARYLKLVDEIANERRFFHWELEFPEVFFGKDGVRRDRPGFDAVIGNPPWDMLRADAGSTDARTQARGHLSLFLRFVRDSRAYDAHDGHVNRYQLFLERAVALSRCGARLGLVLPAGFATDHGSAALRRSVLTRCDVDALVGIDNRRGVFPIHRSVGFLLLTASCGAPTRTMSCRFGVTDPAELESIGDDPSENAMRFPVQLSPSLLHRLSGESLSIPLLPTALDLAIAERASTLFRPLGDERGWSARFGRELNATEDRSWFTAPHSGLPVVEGKYLEPFRVDLDLVRYTIAARDARRLLPDGRHERPRLAYRDVSGATNRLTLIAAVLPAGCVSIHTVFCLRTPLSMNDQHFLCGLFNSFVVNYLVRPRVTTHVTTAIVESLPIPTRDHAPGACREIAALGRSLARKADPDAHARLQARVAQLYQLSRSEFAHALSTFPLVPREERDAALRVFDTQMRRAGR